MAATPENKVKDNVVSVLKDEGAYYFFPATHGYGRSGVPDIIACVNGRFLAIECKAGGGKLTALQVREIKRILACNGEAIIANENNLDLVRQLVRELSSKEAV